MKKKFFVFFLLLFLVGFVYGLMEEKMSEWFDERGNAKAELISKINEFNKETERIPIGLRILFGNEEINLSIKMENGKTERFGVIIKDSRVVF